MRGFIHIGVVAGLALTAAVIPHGQAGDPAKVLAAAREALGGEKRLSAVRTFVATGRTRQVRGDNLVPIEFEIACELPDKYVRKDEIPAQESGPTAAGFNGDALIQTPGASGPAAPSEMSGRAGGPAAPPTEAQLAAARATRVATAKQDFVRLTLGMFATSFSSFPLTFTYVGQAEAPQGRADVVDVKGAANFTVRLFVNTETHLPIMVSWQLPAPQAGRGGGRGRGPASAPSPPSSESGDARAAAPAPAAREARIYYAEYRDVDGMQFPFRLRRSVAGETVEETTFDRFKINTKIDPKKFEASK